MSRGMLFFHHPICTLVKFGRYIKGSIVSSDPIPSKPLRGISHRVRSVLPIILGEKPIYPPIGKGFVNRREIWNRREGVCHISNITYYRGNTRGRGVRYNSVTISSGFVRGRFITQIWAKENPPRRVGKRIILFWILL